MFNNVNLSIRQASRLYVTSSILCFCFITVSSQVIGIKFPHAISATSKKGVGTIPTGSGVSITGIQYSKSDQAINSSITAIDQNGKKALIPFRKIDDFEFKDLTEETIWFKFLLLNGGYESLVDRGYQYDIRNNANEDAIEYLRTIGGQFFNDNYFEDYVYTLLRKIHPGVLSDGRPGNVYFKVVKDPQPNAFTLPNGCVILTTGLLSTIQSEDELIGVIAHEVAHFVLDHHILNYNKEIDRKKRAEFWAGMATVAAAATDTYLTVNNKNHIPGILTAGTAVAASIISEDIATRLGIKYNREQEFEADNLAKEILKLLQYDKDALSIALRRIKSNSILTGNYYSLAGNTHPSLDSRIGSAESLDLQLFTQPAFLKKVSLINSYNAWIELWSFDRHLSALELAERNISNNIATESDYIVKAIVKRRLSNTTSSNQEVLSLLAKAKSLDITPYAILHKEEAITYLRLKMPEEAKKAFQLYLNSLMGIKNSPGNVLANEIQEVDEEIAWTKKMIFKTDNL